MTAAVRASLFVDILAVLSDDGLTRIFHKSTAKIIINGRQAALAFCHIYTTEKA